jgi:DNA-3-methyladenine glycosylase
MHYCCYIVTGPEGEGAAVLIRAVEPVAGEEILRRNRNKSGVELTNGPAKLCQALDIDRQMNGHDLSKSSLTLELQPPLAQQDIVQTTRIGIKNATDIPWRFYIRGNDWVSRP